MARLRELVRLVRSKNAGPFELTFDIMFTSPETYEQVKRSGFITAKLFADLYGAAEESVRIYAYDPAFSYKVTIPRLIVSGSVGDNDVYGCQQFGPLVDIDVAIDAPAVRSQ